MPDGTSHLLLRIDEDNDLIDAKNPNRAKGKYKYRFKRLDDKLVPDPVQPAGKSKSKKQQGGGAGDDSDESSPSGSSAKAGKKSGSGSTRPAGDQQQSEDDNSGTSGVRKPKSRKSGLDDSDDLDASQKSGGKGGKKSSRTPSQMEFVESDQEIEQEQDSDNEISVANENFVTKLTKDKEKKINQEKTVIIDEKYEITPDIGDDKGGDDTADEAEDGLLEKDEQTKSYFDTSTRVTKKEGGRDKPTKTEVYSKYEHIEPESQASVKELGDEKLVEKLKPEETIQYEYEQVIEQPKKKTHQKKPGQKSSDDDDSEEHDNTDSVQVENTQKRTTKHETREKFEKIEKPTPDTKKVTTTDLTTLITEEEQDKITETIENTKDSEEFSYSQLQDNLKKSGQRELRDLGLDELVESVTPSEFESNPDDNMRKVKTIESFE